MWEGKNRKVSKTSKSDQKIQVGHHLQMYSDESQENHCCLVSLLHHHLSQDIMSNGLHLHNILLGISSGMSSSHHGVDVQHEEEDQG